MDSAAISLPPKKKKKLFGGTLAMNDSKVLGEKGAKAGLHCYHSNAELQKLEHGEMGGGQCFHPLGRDKGITDKHAIQQHYMNWIIAMNL